MKTGRSLNKIAIEMNRLEQTKKDFLVPTPQMKMSADAKQFSFSGSKTRENMGMSNLFHSQIGAALGIPGNYYNAMRRELPGLLSDNVNAWFAKKDGAYMVRTIDRGNGREARAFLSKQYRIHDNQQILGAVLPPLMEEPDVTLESCEMTENKLYIKAVNHRIERDVVPGDTVQFGVLICNSEVGLGAVSVMPLVYRLVCTNGMVVNALGERKRHVGKRRDYVKGKDYYTIFSDEALAAEDKAFELRLRDVVAGAFDEARFDRIVDTLRDSTQRKITGKVTDVVELTSKNFGLNSLESDGILKYLITGGDLSQYGLSNAVTRMSQDAEDYDRATTIETVGWEVASMNAKSWKELNAAV